MTEPFKTDHETDPRFPSGRWTGYYLEQINPGRQMMELILTFRQGQLTGEGRDRVGPFLVRGGYSLADGKCDWLKSYVGKHNVNYHGFNEGKGIWGVWEIAEDGLRGGFHIWPEGMADPTGKELTEEAEAPLEGIEEVEAEPVAQPVGFDSVHQ